jgi:hypothetical protein
MAVKLQEKQLAKLNLNAGAGRSLLMAITIVLALSVALEATARSAWFQRQLPFQAYGANHVQFEMQIANLKAYTAEFGEPECLIVGTSQALRSLDPQVMDEVYQGMRGERLGCYNFSVVGANLISTQSFVEYLLEEHQPRLLVVGVSFLDFTQAREKRFDPRFQENAWLAYRLGVFSLEGWLVEHSYAYRALVFTSYSAPTGLDYGAVEKDVRKWQRELTRYGHGHTEETFRIEREITPGEASNFLKEFDDFTVSSQNLESLENIIRLAKEAGAQVIVVEMPYHRSLVELTGVDEALRQQAQPLLAGFLASFEQQGRAIAARQAVPFWSVAEAPQFTNTSWLDRYHLNAQGSAIFSAWLAERIAQAAASGEIFDTANRP